MVSEMLWRENGPKGPYVGEAQEICSAWMLKNEPDMLMQGRVSVRVYLVIIKHLVIVIQF